MALKRNRLVKLSKHREADRASFNWRRSLSLALHTLREAGLLQVATVALVGSYARGAGIWRSDVDVLVLTRGPRSRPTPPYGVHFQLVDVNRFQERLSRGDDYALAALKFGKLLRDGLSVWPAFREQAVTAKWPGWREKLTGGHRRAKLARYLLEASEGDAATEEMLLAATQIARGGLLRHGIYPFSRPELSAQLRAIGEHALARDMDALIESNCDDEELGRISEHLEAITAQGASASA